MLPWINLTVVRTYAQPVINQHSSDAANIPGGFEGGTTIRRRDGYHLFAHAYTKTDWSETLLDHWHSVDGNQWSRKRTLWSSHWQNGSQPVWVMPCSPMPFYNTALRRWYIYYSLFRQPRQEFTPNGTLWAAPAATAGADGLDGSFDFPGKQMLNATSTQPWEGGDLDSISAPYQTADSLWHVIYGSGNPPFYGHWRVGLATAHSPLGRFVRDPSNPLPIYGCVMGNRSCFVENLVPTWQQLPTPSSRQQRTDSSGAAASAARGGAGLWIAPFDLLSSEGESAGNIGIALSRDGIHWPAEQTQVLHLTGKHNGSGWTDWPRTPHQLIPEDDGTYTLFFTAYPRDRSPFRAVGRASIAISITQSAAPLPQQPPLQ